MREGRSRVRAGVALLLIGSQLACMGPLQRYPAADYVNGAAPSRVKVALADGSMVELSGPQVVLDSLLTGWKVSNDEFVGYPLTDVQYVEMRERSTARTIALLGGITVVLMAVVLTNTGTGPVIHEFEDDLTPRPPAGVVHD